MVTIMADEVGRHDFLITRCSKEMVRVIYRGEHPHHRCQGNLERALSPCGVESDRVPIAFNVFMNVFVDGDTGKITVLLPHSATFTR